MIQSVQRCGRDSRLQIRGCRRACGLGGLRHHGVELPCGLVHRMADEVRADGDPGSGANDDQEVEETHAGQESATAGTMFRRTCGMSANRTSGSEEPPVQGIQRRRKKLMIGVDAAAAPR